MTNYSNETMELNDLSSLVVTWELNERGYSEGVEYPSTWFQADLDIPEKTEDEIELENEAAEMAEDMEMEMRLEDYN